MKLYSNNSSPNCKRVRVCAAELGIALNIVDMDVRKGDNRKPEYVSTKNPMGKIPTLEDDDGFVIWESNAINTYLASKNPQKNLFPSDAKNRAEVMRWLFWCSAHYEQAVFGLLFEKMIKPALMGADPDPARVETLTKDWNRYAPVLDKHLQGKQWIVGDNITLADISLGVVTECTVPAGLDLAAYPNMRAWLGRLTEREAWKKASQQ